MPELENSGESNIDSAVDFRARAESLEQQLEALQREADSRVVRAELKAEAVRAGMIDMDGLKLLDLSRISVGEDGDVRGGSQAIAELRKAKPWLFAGISSSTAAAAPPALPTRQKLATEMTDDEYREAKSVLLRRYA